MSSAAFQNDLLMFGDLLAHLRQQGFRIGVDHYLRLQQLLDRVGDTCAPEELRTLLCPIFATSRTQQEQFYKVFDSYFALFQLAARPTDTDETFSETSRAQKARTFNRRTSLRKWLSALTPVALAALIIGLVLFLKPKTSEQSTQTQTKANASVSTENVNLSSTPEPTPETLVVTATESPAQQTSAQASTPIPTPTPTPTPEQSFYQRHQTAIQTLIILSPLIIFLLYEWYRFARRKLLLQKQHTRKPPLVWPIKVDAPEDGIYDSEQFLTAARQLRRRQRDEYRRLDVEATVAATIERLGFPDFRYKSDSRVPEYLVLIDRASYRDHQARLFDELTRALEREGVFVVRYFFDGDPRVSFDKSGAGVVQLTELQNRYSTHRLIIFGNGEKLLDQITGRLDAWTAIFQHWQDRALLTIEPPARWGLREIALAQLFIVLPATLNGLLALVDHFETTMQADLRSWVGGDFESAGLERSAAETVASLRRILGEDVFQWLAACAVYTELQWNLTLYIGSLPSMPPRLLTETNLLKLIRLPWFRTGAMPDEVRWLLIRELTPERQRSVRAALIELLERDPAPPETFASDQYRLNLFAQRWLQSRTHKRLRELMQLVKQLPRSQVLRDLTLIRFLESARRSPVDFLLPDRLRKLFYQRGVPAFGMKTGARFLLMLFFVAVAWIGVSLLAPTPVSPVSAKSSETQPIPSLSESDQSIPPKGMVYVPRGEFMMGNDDGDLYERPSHKVAVKPFFIDIYEVTNEEYAKFIKATNRLPPPSWVDGTYPDGTARKPVTLVNWDDASAYALWAGKRLPTEEEWEFAARGTDGRLYPWGNQWERGIANASASGSGKLVEVGTYKRDVSPFGVFDMVGNAWEWTASDLQAYPGGQLPKHPSGDYKVIRGGSWKEDEKQATATYRGYLLARGGKDYSATGFRCVKDVGTSFSSPQEQNSNQPLPPIARGQQQQSLPNTSAPATATTASNTNSRQVTATLPTPGNTGLGNKNPSASDTTSIFGSVSNTSSPNQPPLQDEPPPPVKQNPQQQSASAVQSAPVSLGVLNGRAISLPKPDYPQKAVAARAAGRVVVQVTIDESGKVISAQAQSGNPLLQKAAVDAAYKARFSPTLLSGVPVKITGTINYDFVLKQPPPEPQPNEPRPGFPGQRPPPGRP